MQNSPKKFAPRFNLGGHFVPRLHANGPLLSRLWIYEKEWDNIGSAGDFFTSLSVGPLFGQLLAHQFCEWLDCPETVSAVQPSTDPHTLAPSAAPPRAGPALHQLMEAGAHDGMLAKDILTWIQANRPSIFGRLEYWIIEPSASRRSRQQRTLASFGAKVQWAPSFYSKVRGERAANQERHATRNTQHATRPLPSDPSRPSRLFHGIIFSNELLDAFPVHRLGWDAGQRSWFEWGVGWDDERFAWIRMPEMTLPASRLAPKLPDDLLAVMPDGFTTEVSPEALDWWRQAASSLASGKLMAIDYGLEVEEFFEPHRAEGTLRAYRKHHPSANILADPGEQDITAQVNFSALKEAGESCGLVTEPVPNAKPIPDGHFCQAFRQNGVGGGMDTGANPPVPNLDASRSPWPGFSGAASAAVMRNCVTRIG